MEDRTIYTIETTNTAAGFDIYATYGVWTLDAAAQLTSEDDVVLFQPGLCRENVIYINGSILADVGQVAFRSLGRDGWIAAGDQSTITGAIEILGARTTFVNRGEASADGTFVLLGGIRSHFYNTGTIVAGEHVVSIVGENAEFGNEGGEIESVNGSVIIASNAASIYNSWGGTITAQENAVVVNTKAGQQSEFKNSATVTAGDFVYIGGAGRDICKNYGIMSGDVQLGGGNDSFEIWSEAQFDGTVYGGKGDDRLILNSEWVSTGAPINLPTFEASWFVELAGEGTDTVVTYFDWTLGSGFENAILKWRYNSDLTGNELRNVLEGNEGRNRLSGEAGNDKLIGGKNIDTFYFADGFGKDRIIDFGKGHDLIDLSGLSEVVCFRVEVSRFLHRELSHL